MSGSCHASESWHPGSSIEVLRARAEILAKIRRFFHDRNVLEVETPSLSHATVTDPFILSIPAVFQHHQKTTELYLQTSPEFAMKRLLAAGSGSIFQICKAFRQGDLSPLHNPEFTMLEWYRIGFDHHDLMNEMDELLQLILKTPAAERMTYQALFEKYANLNPHNATIEELENFILNHIELAEKIKNKNTLLELIFTHCIEPQIGKDRPFFLYDFPVSMAALAKIRDENPKVASRFEVYYKGIELANGFHELQDSAEQRKRFEIDLEFRKQNQIPTTPIDENFLAALAAGLPECAGVALGVDRLVMLALDKSKITDVMSFSCERS